MIRTSSAAKAFAVAVSGVLHAAAFAAAAPRAGANRRAGDAFEIPVVVEAAEDSPAPAPTPEPPRSRAQEKAVPASPPVRAPFARPAPEPPAPASQRVDSSEAPAAVTRSSRDEPPRFVMVVGGATSTSVEGGEPEANGSARREGPILPVEEATTPARLVAASPPRYPIAARADGIEGDVKLEMVVDATGRVQSARVLGAPSREFDAAALDAAASYRFAPATLHGRAVRVRMRWSVEFRLK